MYNKHIPEFRCTVVKDAISHGPQPTVKKYGSSESTVQGFLKSFKETQSENSYTQLETVPRKERGRPTLLPEEINHKMITMIKKMRESGSVINYNIIRTIATGIIVANDRTLFKENGGSIELGKSGVNSFRDDWAMLKGRQRQQSL